MNYKKSSLLPLAVLALSVVQMQAASLLTGQALDFTASTTALSLTAGNIQVDVDNDIVLTNDGSGNLVGSLVASPVNSDWSLMWGSAPGTDGVENVNMSLHTYVQVDFAAVSAGLVASNWSMFWQDDDSSIGGLTNSFVSFGSVSPQTAPFSVLIDLTDGGTNTSGATGWGPGALDLFRLDMFEDPANAGESFTISAVTFGSAVVPVPEPSAVVLLGLTGALVLLRRRRIA